MLISFGVYVFELIDEFMEFIILTPNNFKFHVECFYKFVILHWKIFRRFLTVHSIFFSRRVIVMNSSGKMTDYNYRY